jgi:hypothetical protein
MLALYRGITFRYWFGGREFGKIISFSYNGIRKLLGSFVILEWSFFHLFGSVGLLSYSELNDSSCMEKPAKNRFEQTKIDLHAIAQCRVHQVNRRGGCSAHSKVESSGGIVLYSLVRRENFRIGWRWNWRASIVLAYASSIYRAERSEINRILSRSRKGREESRRSRQGAELSECQSGDVSGLRALWRSIHRSGRAG